MPYLEDGTPSTSCSSARRAVADECRADPRDPPGLGLRRAGPADRRGWSRLAAAAPGKVLLEHAAGYLRDRFQATSRPTTSSCSSWPRTSRRASPRHAGVRRRPRWRTSRACWTRARSSTPPARSEADRWPHRRGFRAQGDGRHHLHAEAAPPGGDRIHSHPPRAGPRRREVTALAGDRAAAGHDHRRRRPGRGRLRGAVLVHRRRPNSDGWRAWPDDKGSCYRPVPRTAAAGRGLDALSRRPLSYETSRPGLFAVGDLRWRARPTGRGGRRRGLGRHPLGARHLALTVDR